MKHALPRWAAAGVAAITWVGLAVQFSATFANHPSLGATLWILARFFTVTTNLIVATVFTGIALDAHFARSPRLIGGVTLFILLVGVIYALLLRGQLELSGGAKLADILLHMVTPTVVPLYWLAFVSKGRLQRRDPLIWTLYPAAYLGYALLRGRAEGQYAYPFINVAKLGWTQVALNVVAIAAGFILCGYLLLILDRFMGRKGA